MNSADYIINTMEKHKKYQNLLTATYFFIFASALSDIFVNIFIWRVKAAAGASPADTYITLAVFGICCYAVIPFIFYLCGYVAMRFDRIKIYQAGVLLHAAYYLAILGLNERVADYLLLIGILKGLAMGTFWFGHHVLTFDYTDTANRDSFFSKLSIVTGISSIITPLASGYIISRFPNLKGYYIIFVASAALFSAVIFYSLTMKSGVIKTPFKIEDLLFSKNPKVRGTMISLFFIAAKEVIALFLITLLVYQETKNEFKLGNYMFLVAGFSILTSFVMGKISKPSNRPAFVLAGGIIYFAAVMLLMFKINFTTLLVYGIVAAIGDCILRIPFNAHTLDILTLEAGGHERRMEYIVARDVPIAVGRILLLVIFIIFLRHLDKSAVKAILLLISTFPVAMYWFLFKHK